MPQVTESRIPWPRKPWGFGGPSYPRAYRYGLMTPRRKLISRAFLPGPRERRMLGRNHIPFWHVMDFTLGAQVSDDSNVVPVHNFVALGFLGTSSQPAGFRTQFFQLIDESGKGARFSSTGVNAGNAVGTARNPLMLRIPYPMPNLFALINRTANLATVTNDVQIVVFGVRDMDHLEGESEG